ncbi:serine/arginine repetitive matrix protein 1 isoform X10 [Anopheles gambiae]|uniref:serine/arginine repetitive matrix protein 1 isoform X10 n=1 Tax=Anopheles gambiae TaxID=7165 RepID=UPI002AC999EF|nr:serine/arginine repetitive matrix protein 1 isoform X10 [Anopheles gambiae]XP_061506005.1 serine/arginine repetitive matrix protein 1 isoform X10 [Anopheles gambiae]XP_061506006.1 serine/arginine repetitive matrix protein 1 isoform X10 [Anopheles gambiae]
MSKYAWVTLATNDSYSLGALVVAHSLKRVHTEHQTAVLITPGVSESMKTKLRAVFNVVEEVNLLDSKDEANLALLKRPELGVTFTKLHCWRLTQFEKCVFLDADTLVLRNCDELFEREELSAAPDIGWPDCFNSGVYVYTPNMETFSSLVQYAVTHGSFDGGDQGLLNSYFSDWAHKDIQKHLPFIYNTSSVATYSYLPAFKQFGQNTKILHFIGVAKPWLQNFNSETRKVYVPSECQHLANFLQYWWDIFAEDVHSRLSPDMRTDQWVDKMIQQHEANIGHWEKAPSKVYEVQEREPFSFNTVDPTGYQLNNKLNPQDSAGDRSTSVKDSTETITVEEIKTVALTSQQQTSCPDLYEPAECQANVDGGKNGEGDGSGIAGALAQLHLGEAKSKEQEAYEEHMRRQCWETGNIDYMGRDSFDNIWKRIQQTINTGSCMEESSEASVAQTTAPGTTQRASRRPSRSRSATPKRDPKDRSPTPQPEEKISVDKKEAQVVPPPVIAEEDDVAVSLSTMDCSSFAIRLQTSRLPPPIQYDPTTNTTTLTKKVFAGYQQIITTKSPEGKTRTHTKLVYDPSVEDDETKEEANVPLTTPTVASNQDVVDGTVMQKATVNTPPVSSKQKITTAAAEGGMKEMSSTKTAMQASNITPGIKKDANVSQSPMPKSASNPTAPSSAQQPQQQVAQESLAGKTNAFFETQQPVKALRKKRHISPPPQPLPTTNATSNNQASGKASTSSSPLSSSSSSATNALHRGLPANPKASVTTAILPSVVSHPSIASSSKAEASNTQNTLNTRTFLNNQKDESALTLPLLEKTSTPASQSSPSTKSSTETKPNHTAVEGSKVGSPPVPPRRKRESRTAKIAKAKKSKIYQLLLSCISCTKKKR